MDMGDNLPSLAAIRVFEAASRLMSFTKAAAELGMTQAAVSYQIKLLEERLGAPLFLRQPRALALTSAGQWLAPRTSEAFDLLRAASQDQARERRRSLASNRIRKLSSGPTEPNGMMS